MAGTSHCIVLLPPYGQKKMKCRSLLTGLKLCEVSFNFRNFGMVLMPLCMPLDSAWFVSRSGACYAPALWNYKMVEAPSVLKAGRGTMKAKMPSARSKVPGTSGHISHMSLPVTTGEGPPAPAWAALSCRPTSYVSLGGTGWDVPLFGLDLCLFPMDH